MCVRFCEFWTCRILLFGISSVSVIISFILGPLHTLFYVIGLRPELNKHFENEVSYAILLCFILVVLWIIFISNVILLFACCYTMPRLLDAYVVLVIINMVLSFTVATGYLIHCSFFDKKCFNHSKSRTGDDKGGALVLFAADLLYLVASIFIIFLACNYKLTTR